MGSHHDEIHFNLDIVKEEYCMNRENGSVIEEDGASDVSDCIEYREEFIEDDSQDGQDDQEIVHFEITEIEQSGSQKKGESELVSELVCLICEQTFDKLSLLKAHMHTHSNAAEDSTFQCPYCPLVYGYKRFLDEHLQQSHAEESSPEENDSSYLSHFSEPLQTEDLGLPFIEVIKKMGCKDMFKCRACSRIFKKKIHLRNHITIHTSEKPYVCQTCGEAFRRKDYLNIHSTKHTNVNKTCPICNKELSDLECLRRHLNKHVKTKTTKKGGIICEVCLKTFNNQASYTIHMRKWHPEHPEEKKNKAPPRVVIKKEFPDRPVIKLKTIKKIPSKNTFKCIPCNQLFKTRKILTKHERTKRHLQALEENFPVASPESPMVEANFICKICGSPFAYRKDYTNHLRSHKERLRKYDCPQCPLKFKRKNHLDDHMMTHDPNRPVYICHCGKEYKCKKSLITRHFKVCSFRRYNKMVNGTLIKTEKMD